jgi:6-pyruvoyltetrahydropterin/6-carboxytetrahydropterin synthase
MKTYISCTKRYDNLPAGHRQPNHDGHCSQIHGHDFGFEFEFGVENKEGLDECGFVVDFGKLNWLKNWLKMMFDHTLLLNLEDPQLNHLTTSLDGLADIRLIPDCSAEGLAVLVYTEVNLQLQARYHGRVQLLRVTVFEDSKNSATLRGE